MPDTTPGHRVVVSTGDPAGSSPELIGPLLENVPESVALTLVGPGSVRDAVADVLEQADGRHQWLEVGSIDPDAVLSGELSAESGQAAYRSVQTATERCHQESVEGIMTLPLSKEAVHRAGHEGFRGHTAYFEGEWDCRSVMTFLGDTLNVALLTRHIPLKEVPDTLTEPFVVDQIKTATLFFERYQPGVSDFACLGLNPHAGEQGLIGTEEVDLLEPCLDRLRSDGISIDGPFPPDSFFPVHADNYDCVFACYHDQGLIPFKVDHFYTGVHASLGLPVLRVSPDHGVAADLAGQNEIDPRSTINGIRTMGEWLAVEELDSRQTMSRE